MRVSVAPSVVCSLTDVGVTVSIVPRRRCGAADGGDAIAIPGRQIERMTAKMRCMVGALQKIDGRWFVRGQHNRPKRILSR